MSKVYKYKGDEYKMDKITEVILSRCYVANVDTLTERVNPNKVFKKDEFYNYLKETYSDYYILDIEEITDLFSDYEYNVINLFKIINNEVIDVVTMKYSVVCDNDVFIGQVSSQGYTDFFVDYDYHVCTCSDSNYYILNNNFNNRVIHKLQPLK